MVNISDPLTARIINAIIEVHQTLGPGFLENIYRNALVLELERRGFQVRTEEEVVIRYRGELIGRHRLDLVVNDAVLLELKTVENLGKYHYAQVRSYLKASGFSTGLLVNFASSTADFRRIEHPAERCVARAGSAPPSETV